MQKSFRSARLLSFMIVALTQCLALYLTEQSGLLRHLGQLNELTLAFSHLVVSPMLFILTSEPSLFQTVNETPWSL